MLRKITLKILLHLLNFQNQRTEKVGIWTNLNLKVDVPLKYTGTSSKRKKVLQNDDIEGSLINNPLPDKNILENFSRFEIKSAEEIKIVKSENIEIKQILVSYGDSSRHVMKSNKKKKIVKPKTLK